MGGGQKLAHRTDQVGFFGFTEGAEKGFIFSPLTSYQKDKRCIYKCPPKPTKTNKQTN